MKLTHPLHCWALVPILLLAACASSPRGAPGYYEQTTDSATSSCLRNPACYDVPAGEEAALPWLSRGVEAARTAHATLKLLEAAQVARVEQILVECAEQAERIVNARHFGRGGQPSEAACREVRGRDAKGRAITRAMQLGDEKHREALQCASNKLVEFIPGNFSLEPTYLRNGRNGPWRWIDPQTIKQRLAEGLSALLQGRLVPDVVLHATGDPLKIQHVYDFKFPCPKDEENYPTWKIYDQYSPYAGKEQGVMYSQLGGEQAPAMVAPLHGVRR